MIVLSNQITGLYTKVFTFGGIAFCLKVLPITQITVSDVNIGLESKNIAVGMLSALTAYLVISIIIMLIRDKLQQSQADAAAYKRQDSAPVMGGGEVDPVGRNYILYIVFSALSIVTEAVFPILFGLFVIFVCRTEAQEFLSKMANVLTEIL